MDKPFLMVRDAFVDKHRLINLEQIVGVVVDNSQIQQQIEVSYSNGDREVFYGSDPSRATDLILMALAPYTLETRAPSAPPPTSDL